MKTLTLVMCVLCASVVWGQAAVGQASLSAEPQVIHFFSHNQHASQSGMGTEHRVLERSNEVVEHGTKPLWEFAPASESIPLGDIARALRQEHETAQKAPRVWTN